MTKCIGICLLAIVSTLTLTPIMQAAQPEMPDNAVARQPLALEEVIRDREVIRRAVRSGRCDEETSGRAYAFDEAIPVADEWLFLKGGSFSICSDDIVVFALYHPSKEILRILFTSYTGTIEDGLFLIGCGGRRIVVSQECIGTDPPRGYVIQNGIPVEDLDFRNAFRDAFARLKASRKDLHQSCRYIRSLSFHTPEQALQLDLTIDPLTDDDPVRESVVTMVYSGGRVRVTPRTGCGRFDLKSP